MLSQTPCSPPSDSHTRGVAAEGTQTSARFAWNAHVFFSLSTKPCKYIKQKRFKSIPLSVLNLFLFSMRKHFLVVLESFSFLDHRTREEDRL